MIGPILVNVLGMALLLPRWMNALTMPDRGTGAVPFSVQHWWVPC